MCPVGVPDAAGDCGAQDATSDSVEPRPAAGERVPGGHLSATGHVRPEPRDCPVVRSGQHTSIVTTHHVLVIIISFKQHLQSLPSNSISLSSIIDLRHYILLIIGSNFTLNCPFQDWNHVILQQNQQNLNIETINRLVNSWTVQSNLYDTECIVFIDS